VGSKCCEQLYVGLFWVSVVVSGFWCVFMKLLMCGNLFPFCSLLYCTIFFRFSHFLCWNADSMIRLEGAVAIAEALKSNQCLKKLNLYSKCCVNHWMMFFFWVSVVVSGLCGVFMKLLMCGNLLPFCSLLYCTIFWGFLTSCVEIQEARSGRKEQWPLLKHWSRTSVSKTSTWAVSVVNNYMLVCFGYQL